MTAPAPPPPPQATGTVAPPRRRRSWIVVLVSVLVAILAVIGVGTALFVANTLPPFSAADEFMEDLADARFDAAAAQLCAADLERPEAAISSVTRHFFGGRRLSVNPFTVDREGDRATVEYTVRPRSGGDDRIYDLPMREERGEWKPCPGAGR